MARNDKRSEQDFEDLSSYSFTRDRKRSRSRRGLTPGMVVGAVICGLLIAVGGIMIYISTALLEGLTANSITKDPGRLGIDADAVMDDSITNIALFGVDSRNDTFSGESDMIAVLTVDNKHGKLKLTSIMRNSRVPVEGNTLSGEYLNWDTKINTAYYYGGPELAIRTLNQNYGLDITDYVTVNFSNMAAIVDAFDGVDVTLTAEEVREINKNLWSLSQDVISQQEKDREKGDGEYTYPAVKREDFIPDGNGELNVDSGYYTGGTFHLNGNQAVAYSRIRDVGDDSARVDRQHTIFRCLVEQVSDIARTDYPDLIQNLMTYCETSLDLSSIVRLTPILTNDFTVETIRVPDAAYETDLFDGRADDGIYYLIYDVQTASQRINSFILEEESLYWSQFGNTADSSQGN